MTLQVLQQDSGKRISDSVIAGMTQRFAGRARYQLVRYTANPSGRGYAYLPTNGVASLAQHTQAVRKLPDIEDNFIYLLNTALLGGTSYPILTAVLSVVVGAASGGAGLLFTIFSTGMTLSQTSQRVLARAGDELWQVEEIGRIGRTAIHVGSYFLVDPYRTQRQSRIKGWLIHEERIELDIEL